MDITDDGCNPYLEYVLTKNEIDNAHKDKQNKLYPPDFKVGRSMDPVLFSLKIYLK